ncbi:hypothetical protein [Maricaulis sp.]|uniref:hypothetical protein n=1 Tax=Maricaulis sp. TaxID=1486257 RepID=UPI003A904A99
MTVKVSFNEETSILAVEGRGQVLRREAGWAAERSSELIRTHPVGGVLVDCFAIQQQSSPALSAEMISEFVAAIETGVPIAYVRSESWNADYCERVVASLDSLPENARVFLQVDIAVDWLRAEVPAPAPVD